ncbi:MAG: hypothetical protein H6595_02615 [Flavobacteriales bacterium]|nr:hypothetical protein [Flavobacteriales bacterium]MCB9166351.1 hypothetical protein [Flavobacteriales bacterium]
MFTLLVLTRSAVGQVHVDGPMRMTATDSTQRTIEGIDTPVTDTDLITMGVSRSGSVNWGMASGSASAIQLTLDPPASRYAEGLVVRFLPTQSSAGAITLNVDGLGPRDLLGRERLPLQLGDLVAGQIAEARYTDSVFVFVPHPVSGCPEGYVAANDHLCVQVDDGPSMSFFNASHYCTGRGARLCTWDEYIHACVVLGPQLTGLFNEWEWIDDTSDHTHTADQVGRWQCISQRSVGAVEHPNNYGEVRCCYRLP